MLAQHAQGLAADGDGTRLGDALDRLIGELGRHVESEHVQMDALPTERTRVLHRARRNLTDLAHELSNPTIRRQPSRCYALLNVLIAELAVLSEEERRAFSQLPQEEPSSPRPDAEDGAARGGGA